jgi:hypothetical protein
MMLNRRSSSSPIDVHTQGGTSRIHHTDVPDTGRILQVASNPPSFSQGDPLLYFERSKGVGVVVGVVVVVVVVGVGACTVNLSGRFGM